MFKYFENGHSFVAVDADYAPVPGLEAVFSDYATDEQLLAAFPNYKSDQERKYLFNQDLKDQINALELKQGRILREISLGHNSVGGDGKTPIQRLEEIDNQIQSLRVQFVY